jgi:hypothetical protein
MKIFLSALENATANQGVPIAKMLVDNGTKLKWNLMSYYYIKGKPQIAEYIRDNSELVLIDSGAHSFQFGAKVNFLEYTKKYANFIKEFDRPNVLGYFEMDIENVIGYPAVLELRKILESVSDKIIPVWHPTRGINDYEEMCKKYAGKIVAIGGFRGTDIKDEQFLMFLKVARKYNCKVHCLGMTRPKVLDQVPFDFTDSSSWTQQGIFGKIGKKSVSKEFSKTNRGTIWCENYKIGQQMQKHYYAKWRKECQD